MATTTRSRRTATEPTAAEPTTTPDAPAKKSSAKKTTTKKTAAKRAVAKKTPPEKMPPTQAPAGKAFSKKASTPPPPTPAPAAPAGKASAKKPAGAPAKKGVARKAAAPKKAAATSSAAIESPVEAPAETVAEAPSARPPVRARKRVAAAPAPASVERPAPPLHAHSAVVLADDGLQRRLRFVAGAGCPSALAEAVAARLDDTGALRPDDDDALPALLRLAAEAGHALRIDGGVWQQLAEHRDARHRLHQLERAYPEGPSSAALQQLLRAPLAPFQAEGALFATCAGRALLADERGLGKTVQALAVAALLHRHAGVQQVRVLCSTAQRAGWQREWARFMHAAGPTLHFADPGDDGGHDAGLLVIDEPQRLEGWDRIDAPYALVLCGAPLEEQPALLEAIVRHLDRHRQGPLARLLEEGTEAPLDERLQALMLRRRRGEVLAQLPPLVHSERLLPLAPAQRAAHDRALAEAATMVARWRRSGRLSDAEQWQLGSALAAARQACHRSDPADADSPLAEATLDTLLAVIGELRGDPALRIALLCANANDRALLERRVAVSGRLALALEDAPLPPADVTIRIGVPWRPPLPEAGGPRHWIYLVAEHSIDAGLYDTLALREDVALGPAEGGRDGFLHGARLQRYLLAAEAALRATTGPDPR